MGHSGWSTIMASFVGNTVDENEVAIACDYIGYHYDTGNTSSVHTTENEQYSIDNTDADWDNEGVPFASGDIVLMYMYTETKCAVVRIASDDSDLYSPDIQLKGPQTPTVSYIDSSWVVDTEYTALSSSSDEYQWDYNGITMYHKNNWYGKELCSNIGIETIEYDFGEGYTVIDKHTWATSGDKVVKVRVTNKAGLIAEDVGLVKVVWAAPNVTIGHAPEVLGLNSDITINIVNDDPNNLIVEQSYKLDEVLTTDISTIQLTATGEHEVKVITVWNDGYEDKSFSTTHILNVSNEPPVVDVTMIALTDGVYRVDSNAMDPEGLLGYVKVNIYMESGYVLEGVHSSPNWVLLKESAISTLYTEVKFYSNGKYKIEMLAVDKGGLWSTADSVEVLVECTGYSVTEDGAISDNADKVFVAISGEVLGEIDVTDITADINTIELVGDVEQAELSADIERVTTE